MINVSQFRELIIVPTLKDIGLYSPSAEELLLGTAIQESNLTHLVQLDGDDNPYDDAVGFYQMEVGTHADIWDNYFNTRPEYAEYILQTCNVASSKPHVSCLAYNLRYATAMCRIHYRRVPDALPEPGDLEGMAAYWKTYYNTASGAGKVEDYINNWNAYLTRSFG